MQRQGQQPQTPEACDRTQVWTELDSDGEMIIIRPCRWELASIGPEILLAHIKNKSKMK